MAIIFETLHQFVLCLFLLDEIIIPELQAIINSAINTENNVQKQISLLYSAPPTWKQVLAQPKDNPPSL